MINSIKFGSFPEKYIALILLQDISGLQKEKLNKKGDRDNKNLLIILCDLNIFERMYVNL